MATGVDQLTLVDAIGHDGSELIHPEVNEPYCRRGFHWQELMEAALAHGYAMIPFEVSPVTSPDGAYRRRLWSDEFVRERFRSMLNCRSGVVSGPSFTGYHHAIAWDHNEQLFYDSNGPATRRDPGIKCQIFFVVIPVNASNDCRK